MLYDKNQIMSFLPHRDPFLFVDSVERCELDGKSLQEGRVYTHAELDGVTFFASFHVREDMEILKGHFPGNPILPGVVQVEMMAQCACLTLMKTCEDPENSNITVALVSVSNAKFRKPVVPGMNLAIEAKQTKARGKMVTYDCKINHGDQLISQCSLLATYSF